MERVSGGVKGIVTQAQRAAQKRGQQASTAHLLLVMLQRGGAVGELLSRHGVRESDLLSALRLVDAESQSTVERALERAAKMALRLGLDEPTALHLLLAITRDARSAGHRSLQRMGLGAQRVQADVLARLEAELGPDATGQVKSTGTSQANPSRREPPPRLGPTLARREPTPPRPDRGRRREPRRSAARREPTHPRPPRPSGGTGAPSRPEKRQRKRGPRRPSARRDPASQPTSPPPLADPFLDLLETPDEALVLPPGGAGASDEPGPWDLDPRVFPVLTGMGRNLTALAHAGAFDPVVGREREIDLLLDVLARRRSNNPVLVGAPGVGKTAIVEGLAQRLADGEGVGSLEGRVVVEVSAGSLVSGTGVRGALAEKLQRLREEVAKAGQRVVLFVDEIHAIVGGEGSGPDDLASELKASLARGELPCIGATTEREFRKHFEKDPALVRRFSPIHVAEPSAEATAAILQGVLPRYAQHHDVRYADEATGAAIELSVRFLPERRLPDKAIGVLDLAAARVRRRGGRDVDRAAVASVIAEQARVPLDRLLMKDGERLLRLEGLLGERVVGHRAAMGRIADALRKGAAGFRGRRPLGTFLFLGPTGVGKTETAKAISDVFFGAPMTRLDMSELGESHAVARMLGAPPGYVGHGDGGQLTEAVRKRPYQLVLLDEVEKAHPDVLLALLPLLDEGRLTDGKGRTVDFTNTILVMTSNLGVQAKVSRRVGFGASGAGSEAESAGAQVLAAARRALPPELWNRIDEPIYFGALGRDDVATIAQRMLASLSAKLGESQGVRLEADESVVEALIEAGGYDPALGARPMRRVVGRLVESPLAARILAGDFGEGDAVRARGEGAKVLFERA